MGRRIAMVALGIAIAACGKRGTVEETGPSPRAADVVRVARANDAAREAPFAASGCDAHFPTAGTRFVETTERTWSMERRPPPGDDHDFYSDGAGARLGRVAVTIDEVGSDGAVSRAHAVAQEMTDDDDGGAAAWGAPHVDEYAGRDAAGERAVADTSASAVDSVSMRLDWAAQYPPPVITVAGATRRGELVVRSVAARATLETGKSSMHQSVTDKHDLHGELVVRASDGAFVELKLTGTVTREIVGFGLGQPTSRTFRRGVESTRIARDCFRDAH